MDDQSELQSLEAKIDELIEVCNKLVEENRALRETQTHLMSERATLLEKNAVARSRIESMIARLKSMEVNT